MTVSLSLVTVRLAIDGLEEDHAHSCGDQCGILSSIHNGSIDEYGYADISDYSREDFIEDFPAALLCHYAA